MLDYSFHLKIKQHLYDRLVVEAKKQFRTVSDLCRVLLLTFDYNKPIPDDPGPFDRAIRICMGKSDYEYLNSIIGSADDIEAYGSKSKIIRGILNIQISKYPSVVTPEVKE